VVRGAVIIGAVVDNGVLMVAVLASCIPGYS
jgi:hypothetical protein